MCLATCTRSPLGTTQPHRERSALPTAPGPARRSSSRGATAMVRPIGETLAPFTWQMTVPSPSLPQGDVYAREAQLERHCTVEGRVVAF
jgi:hypothetical protein